MNPSIIQTIKSYISISVYEVYILLMILSSLIPKFWYGIMAGNKSKILKVEGFNTDLPCGCAEILLKDRLKGSWPWCVRNIQTCERLCTFKPPLPISISALCPLCRLLAYSIGDGAKALEIQSLTRYKLGETRNLQGKPVDVWGFEADVSGARSILPLSEDAKLIGRLSDGYARRSETSHASRDRILQWLHRCSNDHPKCRALEERMLGRRQAPRLLINTRNLTVETVLSPVRYLALSYVWGSTPQPKIEYLSRRSLEGSAVSIRHLPLPQVIQDAITLTNELNETYLWVDALCINQDDPQEKVSEITRMNEVYLAATATIVALDSDNADSGLHGIRPYPIPRASHVEIIEGVQFTTIFPPLVEKYSHPDCKWNSRAWTFQEHLLSRRIIFLGSEQAYFSCLTTTYAEDRFEGNDSLYKLYNHPRGLLLDPPTGPRLWQWKVWKHYVELYSVRDITVKTDRAFAFQGILNEQETSGMDFIEALPISYLPLALYWWHGSVRGGPFDQIPNRIDERPSWTWTGWSGQITFPIYARYRSVVNTIEVHDGLKTISYRYSTRGQLQLDTDPAHQPASGRKTLPITQLQCTEGQLSASQSDPQCLKPALSFTTHLVMLNAFADNYRPSYLSIRTSSGKRVGGLSHTSNISNFSGEGNSPVIYCKCVLMGISWWPMAWFGNVELFVGLTAEEKAMNGAIDDVLVTVNDRYKERYEQTKRIKGSRFEIGRALNDPEYQRRPWSAWIYFTAIAGFMVVVALVTVTAMLIGSILFFGIFLLVLVAVSLLYGFYFGCLRPMWICSDHFRVAHVLWIEEINPGVYKRNGVGELKYPAFKKMKPEVRQIQLI